MAKPGSANKVKAAAKKSEVKAVVEKVMEEKVVEEKVVEEKAAEKKPAEKKAPARKTCKTSVCVEMGSLSVDVAAIQNAVKKAVKANGLTASELKVYINVAEQAAYYTVDGEGGEAYKVDLTTL